MKSHLHHRVSLQSHSRMLHHDYRGHQLIPQSHDMIKKEVTSVDVKPLTAKPCFPKQAQVLPLPAIDGHQNPRLQNTRINYHQGYNNQYQSGFSPHQQGLMKSSTKQSHNNQSPGGDNFIYIHRQNSWIDLTQMTHCDHSNLANERSNAEVDAAITLANGLQVIDLKK